MKIFTRTGDKGMTGTHGGGRVCKDDPRIEAVGELDELNSYIGRLRTHSDLDDAMQQLLLRIQTEMMTLMSLVATPSNLREGNPNHWDIQIVGVCEGYITMTLPRLQDREGYFLLPGGSPASADCHICRAATRRAERRLWTLHRIDPLPEELLCFVNRLSDLFFVMARALVDKAGLPEERWHRFAYKRCKRKD